LQKVSGGARLILLTPDADPETARQAMGAKPEHWRVVIEPSPTPPTLEALTASIESDDCAWLDANADKCKAAGFAFNPAIKRIEASDYGGLIGSIAPPLSSGGKRADTSATEFLRTVKTRDADTSAEGFFAAPGIPPTTASG
jgi:hypothetical protein